MDLLYFPSVFVFVLFKARCLYSNWLDLVQLQNVFGRIITAFVFKSFSFFDRVSR